MRAGAEIADRAHCLTEESQAMCGGGLPGAAVHQQAARPVADGPALLEVTGALASAVAADPRFRGPQVGGLALWHAELPARDLKNLSAFRRISRAAGLPGRPRRNGSFCGGACRDGRRGGEAQISPGKSEFKIKCFALLWGKSD